MPSVPVALLKAQLYIEHDLDDALLTQKLDAAEGYVAAFIGGTLPDPVPPAMLQAVLMLAAHWFETREAAVAGSAPASVPYGVGELLQSYRRWVV